MKSLRTRKILKAEGYVYFGMGYTEKYYFKYINKNSTIISKLFTINEYKKMVLKNKKYKKTND